MLITISTGSSTVLQLRRIVTHTNIYQKLNVWIYSTIPATPNHHNWFGFHCNQVPFLTFASLCNCFLFPQYQHFTLKIKKNNILKRRKRLRVYTSLWVYLEAIHGCQNTILTIYSTSSFHGQLALDPNISKHIDVHLSSYLSKNQTCPLCFIKPSFA